MHQRLRSTHTTRFVGALGAALSAATALVIATASSSNCFPLCVLYDEWDVLWYIYQCWQCGA